MPEIAPIVSMQNITKRFAGILAVNQVSLDIYPGEVHGIVGENGAGKSTLMRILAGHYPDYDGTIRISGKLAHLSSPKYALGLGIASVYQELCLVPELSVAENIFLGREFPSALPGLISKRMAEEQGKQILSQIDEEISSGAKVGHLSLAKQQLVEIAKGISMDSRVLILDEPTSSLTAPEILHLFSIIRTLQENGTAVIYISHKLPEVFEITDRITVLRDGVKLETRPTSSWDEASLVRAMVGRELACFYSNTHQHTQKEIALEVSHLTHKPHFEDVSLRVYKGEVLGIYGLIGAGRTELATSICGLAPLECGEVIINGRRVKINSVRDAIKQEIALVPEDRRDLGLFSNLDVKTNLTMPFLNKLSKMGFVRRSKELDLVKRNLKSLEIRVPSIKSLVTTLSGGNQQKVVVGKWLNLNPKVLILDDPTRGIDVGAKAEIRAIVDQLACEGRAIILISSELPEIIGMSDRVLVMRNGRIVSEFSHEDLSAEALGASAAGVNLSHYDSSKGFSSSNIQRIRSTTDWVFPTEKDLP